MAPQGHDRGIVERTMSRLYDRFGWRIMIAVIAAGWLVAMVNCGFAGIWFPQYLETEPGEAPGWWTMMLVAEPGVLVGCVIGLVTSWSTVRPVIGWSPDAADPARAPEVWNAAVRAPAVVVRRSAIAVVVMLTPTVVYAVSLGDLPVYGALPIFVAFAVATTAAAVLLLFAAELAVRPVVEDAAQYLPEGFEPTARSWRLPAKAIAPLPVVTYYTALIVGAFVDVPTSGGLRLGVAVGVALAVVAVASVIFLVVTRSVLAPIDHLIAATTRVRAGDLDTRVPVVTADELGTLSGHFNEMLQGLRERESLREDLRRQAEELRESRARIVATADAERRRMERDLHDGAQQHLVLLNLKLGLLRRRLDDDPDAVAAIEDLTAELATALHELRDLAHGIYPSLLANDGLPAALSEAAERAAIPTVVDCDGAGRYPPQLEAAVYFCCLEALQNAAKHAGPDARATVRLAQDAGVLAFEIADDGRGCDVGALESSAGLANMTDRIGALGGELRILSAPGRGTKVSGVVPVPADPDPRPPAPADR